MTKRLNIYLGDVTHDFGLRTRVVPMGIATLACAAKDNFKEKIFTKLFVYPEKILKETDSNPPDIIAMSNYIWNSKLSLKILKEVKKNHPKVLTVMGGPHCRTDSDGLKDFLKKNPFVDAYVPFEAENPFINLIGKCLNLNTVNIKTLDNVEGVYLNKESYKFKKIIPKNDKKEKYNSNFYTINQFSSPYLNGTLDEFLDDPNLSPLLESNRGCPYSCTFCAWGVGSGNKLIKKDLHKFLSEIRYVAERSKNDVWFLADGNFGILKEDIEIAKNFKELREEFGYPKAVVYNTAKNNPEQVFEVSDILGEQATVNIAVQTFDQEVLKNIKRKNLMDDEIAKFVIEHQKKKRIVSTDLIVPNTGETCESHLNSIRRFFNLGFDISNINLMRMLPGTEMESEKERNFYGIKTKWRPMDAGWGKYRDEFIFESDENVICTNDITESEMYNLKKTHFLTNLFWNQGIGKLLLRLGQFFNVNPLDVIMNLSKNEVSNLSKKILNPLQKEFKEEWFNTEEELINHYKQSKYHDKLLSGEEGLTKLNLKYIAKLMLDKETAFDAIYLLKKYTKQLCKQEFEDELFDIVTKISIDSFRLDLLKGPLDKTIDYTVNYENFKILLNSRLIPESTVFNKNKFTLNYSFPESRFERMKNRLVKYDFENRPEESLYSALTVNYAKFSYELSDMEDSIDIDLKDKQKNALGKADAIRAT